MTPNDIESRLRATLADRAAQAPPGAALAERILAEVEAPARVLRPRRGWRTWTMPLLAAAAVAAVVATIVGIQNDRQTAAPRPPAVSQRVTPSPTLDSSPTPSPYVTPTSPPSPSTSPPAALVDPGGVTGFRALDLTFIGDGEGWAIGPADCVSGPGTCTALFHTSNGTTWTSMPGASFNTPGVKHCAAPCVSHIRFANPAVGYAYSSDVLYMTTDGGQYWTPQPGRGAEALEVLDNNVIRLVSKTSSGCPGPCGVYVETAPIGSSSWTTAQLAPGGISPIAVQLARSGSDAYVLATRNPASGAGIQTSSLYVSTDDGTTWQQRPEPCPQADVEIDSTALAAGGNGTVIALCADRQGPSPDFVAVSHNYGATFVRTAGPLPTSVELVAGDTNTVLVAAGAVARRSTDGGASWAPIHDLAGTVGFLGFESKTVGRALTDGGRTIWTTHDAGRTWHAFDFS